jgi:hypothetical protein
VIGVIAVPTKPVGVDVEVVTIIGVITVVIAVVDGPDPAELVATTVTVYSVPGERPVTATAVEI